MVTWRQAGADIRIAMPWPERRGDKSDFNDVIREDGPEALRVRIEAACKQAPVDAPVRREPSKPARDPRQRETARVAFRLLRMGVPTGELLTVLGDQNARRADPLPLYAVLQTAAWAARVLAGGDHAG